MIRRIVSVVAVIVACIAAVVLTGASDDPAGKIYKAEFDNAFGLTEGGDVRIGGVTAGSTKAFEITAGEPPKAIVEFQITQPGFDSLRTDARCEVRQQSLIGEYYVDCQPGSSDELLPEGGTVPVEQTASVIPTDLVNNVLRRPYRERLRLIIAELGTGLAGRPEELAKVIQRAHPGLRETTRTLGILKNQKRIIQDFVSDSDTVVAELADRKEDVSRFVSEAGETAAISATRKEELAEQFEKFPTFLRELEPTMAKLGNLADEQIPLLADLRAASSDLNRFFTELGPFAQAARPSLRTLGDASVIGKRAFNISADEIRLLRRVARGACGSPGEVGKCPRFATPLRQLLVSLDDRGRAVDGPEPRAATTAPPSPDPTAKKPRRGFTGMESFFNYVFWQTLAINGYDEVSHFLRFLGIESPCSEFNVDPDRTGTEGSIERCGALLGPHQPGIENATGNINGDNYGGSESGDISRPISGSSSSQSSTSSNDGGGGERSSNGGDGGGGSDGGGNGGNGDGDGNGGGGNGNGGGGNGSGDGGGQSSPSGQGGGGQSVQPQTQTGPPTGGAPPDQLLDFLLGP